MYRHSENLGLESHSQLTYTAFPDPVYGAYHYLPPAFSHLHYARYHYPSWTSSIGPHFQRNSQGYQPYPGGVFDPRGIHYPQYHDPRSNAHDVNTPTAPAVGRKAEVIHRQDPPQQRSTRTVTRLTLPAAVNKIIRNSHPPQKPSVISVINPQVKQEITAEGEATPLHNYFLPAEENQAESGSFGRLALASESLLARLIKDDKMRRIHLWRAQVVPMSEPGCDDIDEESADEAEPRLSETHLLTKRKANAVDGDTCPSDSAALPSRGSAKCCKLDSQFDISGSYISKEKKVRVTHGVENNKSPCHACRLAHKKCNGRLSACIHATPKIRAGARRPKLPDSVSGSVPTNAENSLTARDRFHPNKTVKITQK